MEQGEREKAEEEQVKRKTKSENGTGRREPSPIKNGEKRAMDGEKRKGEEKSTYLEQICNQNGAKKTVLSARKPPKLSPRDMRMGKNWTRKDQKMVVQKTSRSYTRQTEKEKKKREREREKERERDRERDLVGPCQTFSNLVRPCGTFWDLVGPCWT